MSDRYRPPSGPKGPRPVPQDKQGWKNPNHRPPNHNGLAANKFKQREQYKPSYNDSSRGNSRTEYGNSSSSHTDSAYNSSGGKQNQSSGRRDGRRNRKRPNNDSHSQQNSHLSNKRRDFTSKDLSAPIQQSPNQIPLRHPPLNPARADLIRDSSSAIANHSQRPLNLGLSAAPKGPRLSQESSRGNQTTPNRPPQGPAVQLKKSSAPKKPSAPRLRLDQLYSVHTVRNNVLYKRVQQVGEGTYGKVYKAINELTGEYVAIKRLRLETEREGFPITAMREIKLLQSFEHPNIVGLLEMMVEQNQIMMIFDYLDHDLTGLLTHPDMHLTEGHKKTIFRQLLDGLNYLHKRRVIHRDIKGSNILLDSLGTLKIADFGLARKMKVLRSGESPDYTNRVITIWYRPPELLMGSTNYGREVDIWGVGCLLIELYTKVATFQGTEEISQLYKIYEIMGTPTLEYWPEIENLPWFEMLKPQINRSSVFEREFRHLMTSDSFDLATKLLEIHPAKRISAEEALCHNYFTNEPSPEPLTFMLLLQGEWHEFETKKRRREERRKIQEIKTSKAAENLELASQSRVSTEGATSSNQTPVAKTPVAKTPAAKTPAEGNDGNISVSRGSENALPRGTSV